MADFAIKVRVSLLPYLINECHQNYCALLKQLVIIGWWKVFIKTSGMVRLIFIWAGRVSVLGFGEGIHQWHSHQTEGGRNILVREMYDYAEIQKSAKSAAQQQKWLLSPGKASRVLSRRWKEQLTNLPEWGTPQPTSRHSQRYFN